jgi:hypothetical protein
VCQPGRKAQSGVQGIIESILGNKATEWLNQHGDETSVIGVVLFVVLYFIWKWFNGSGPSTQTTLTATGGGGGSATGGTAMANGGSGGSATGGSAVATGNTVNVNVVAAPTMPPAPALVAVEPEPTGPSRIGVSWLPGARAMIEVENQNDFPIRCKAIGRIADAANTHKSWHSFPGYWHRSGNEWTLIEPHQCAQVLVATTNYSSGFSGAFFVDVMENGYNVVERWPDDAGEFEYADLVFEFHARPALAEPYQERHRLTWNDSAGIFEWSERVD